MGIPKMPKQSVEKSESQTVSTLIRCEITGRMQVIPKRRSLKSEALGLDARDAETICELPMSGGGKVLEEGNARGGLLGKRFNKDNPGGYDLKKLPDVVVRDGKLLKVAEARGTDRQLGGEKKRKKPGFMD